MLSPFETLPLELLQYIIVYLSPEEACALAQTCRRLSIVIRDDKLWQRYALQRYSYATCTVPYGYTDYLPNSILKSITLPDDCSWQKYFVKRSVQDQYIRSLLDEIISSRKKRIHNATLISSQYGCLALDVLKHYLSPSMNASYSSRTLDSRNFTREYYASNIARLICRRIGLTLLDDIKARNEIPTEGKALINALFIVQCFHPNGIFVSFDRLHRIGQAIIDNPDFSIASLHEKCQLILKAMKTERFLPANSGTDYYDVENSFLFSAFNGKPTIPMTLVSVFCALAEECGLIARPLAFPVEVMAQVEQSPNSSTPLIISVFNGKVLSLSQTNEHLARLIDRPLTYPLPITPINDFLTRSARNIINSITEHRTSSLNSYGLYAAASILKILSNDALPFSSDSTIRILIEHFPMDLSFLEKFSYPMTTFYGELQKAQIQDENPPPIVKKTRTVSTPKYRIGQLFQHRQYNYWAVICGWDLTCTASTLWQLHAGVTNLEHGASQPFYNVLVDDVSIRYVAEDNINTLAFTSIENQQEKNAIIESLSSLDSIGKYFRSVDLINARFVLNTELLNEYPDELT